MGVQFKALKYVIQNYLKKIKRFFFGQFEFEYFGGSDVVNKLLITFLIFSLNSSGATLIPFSYTNPSSQNNMGDICKILESNWPTFPNSLFNEL